MTEWNERVAVITGGASGIGLGMARAFGARGMKLVLADLDEALLQEASEELRAKGITTETKLCDVSKADEIDALADLALNRFGQVNVVCSNAA